MNTHKKMLLRISLLGSLFAFIPLAISGPYTSQKNVACPKVWEDVDSVIPILPAEEVWDSESSEDKAQALAHITPRAEPNTIDAVPVSAQDKVDDPLTLASECLVYRNLEVDTVDYVEVTNSPVDTSLGWLPAAIFQ